MTGESQNSSFLLRIHSLQLTATSPLKIGRNAAPKAEMNSSSKHQFSGANWLLVSREGILVGMQPSQIAMGNPGGRMTVEKHVCLKIRAGLNITNLRGGLKHHLLKRGLKLKHHLSKRWLFSHKNGCCAFFLRPVF